MIVYADVLVVLNTLVDYFLLLATARLMRESLKTIRTVVASFLGGISSLYIFLPPQKSLLEFAYKLVVAFIVTAVCFGFKNIKQYFKSTVVFFGISCAYAGVMLALWIIFKPFGMVINNSVVYFHISPTVLVICTVIGYIIFSALWRLFAKSASLAKRCEITLFADNKSITLNALADTGNSIEDIFEKSEIIIADKKEIEKLFGSLNFEEISALQKRYRILPCSTVSGYDTLDGFRCDSATVTSDGKKVILKKPILAVSKVNFSDDYNAIINPKILR